MKRRGVNLWTALFYVATTVLIIGLGAAATALLIDYAENGVFNAFLLQVSGWCIFGLILMLVWGLFTTEESIAFRRR